MGNSLPEIAQGMSSLKTSSLQCSKWDAHLCVHVLVVDDNDMERTL